MHTTQGSKHYNIPLDMVDGAGSLGGSLTPCFHLPQGVPGPSRLGLPWGVLMLGPGESCPRLPSAPVDRTSFTGETAC